MADGAYAEILAGNYPRREEDSQTKMGDEFLAAARSYQESWNRSEDPFIGLVKSAAETAAGAGQSLFDGIFGRRGGGSGGSDNYTRRDLDSSTRSSRCTISRSYSGPRCTARSRVDRPIIAGISAAS